MKLIEDWRDEQCQEGLYGQRNHYALQNHEAYDNVRMLMKNKRSKPRKEIQCVFCLMNIVFLNDFAEKYASLGELTS